MKRALYLPKQLRPVSFEKSIISSKTAILDAARASQLANPHASQRGREGVNKVEANRIARENTNEIVCT